MPNYSKRRKPLKGALRLFDCEVFVYGMTYFPINPRYIDPNNVVTYKKWNYPRGPPGPDVSAQMRNTSDSGGFLICLIQKASML